MMTITPPSHDLVHVGFDGDRPIFKPRDGSTPAPQHPQLVYQHHNSLGAPVFAQPPRAHPYLQGMPHRRPLWEQVMFGRTEKHTAITWPEKGWRPLCDRARKVAEYYEKHKGDPRLPKKAWDESADRLNEIREVEPFDETSMPTLAANEVERMTRSSLEPAVDSKTTFPIAGHVPQPRIKAPVFKSKGV